MTEATGKYKRGLSTGLVGYFCDRPKKLITIQELEKAFPDWKAHQIRQAVANLINPNAGGVTILGLEKLQTGVWRLVPSEEAVKPVQEELPIEPAKRAALHPQEMVVEILKKRADYLLVESIDDGKIYKMTLVG